MGSILGLQILADGIGYVGVHDAAKRYGYYPRQLYRLIERGKLPAVKFGDRIFVKPDNVATATLKTTLKHKKLPAG